VLTVPPRYNRSETLENYSDFTHLVVEANWKYSTAGFHELFSVKGFDGYSLRPRPGLRLATKVKVWERDGF
jgi:hypothetical protein